MLKIQCLNRWSAIHKISGPYFCWHWGLHMISYINIRDLHNRTMWKKKLVDVAKQTMQLLLPPSSFHLHSIEIIIVSKLFLTPLLWELFGKFVSTLQQNELGKIDVLQSLCACDFRMLSRTFFSLCVCVRSFRLPRLACLLQRNVLSADQHKGESPVSWGFSIIPHKTNSIKPKTLMVLCFASHNHIHHVDLTTANPKFGFNSVL